MSITHTGLQPGAFGSMVIDPEDHAQMEAWGFVYSFDGDGYGRYDRTVDGGRQTLLYLKPGHWAATMAPVAERNPELVVRYAEGFTSPVVAFVTAEVRGWKTQ